jgi:alcohol dehydrogenase (NADP+)
MADVILWQVGTDMKVGVIGLGGLGHMAIKYAKAMGAKVWAITSTPEKATAAQSYGAQGTIVSSSSDDMAAAAHTFDFLLDTIPKALTEKQMAKRYVIDMKKSFA